MGIFAIFLDYYSIYTLFIICIFLIGDAGLLLFSCRGDKQQFVNLSSRLFFSTSFGLCICIATLFLLALFGQLTRIAMLGSMIALTISAVTVSIIYYRRYGRVSINLSATLEQLLWVLPVVLFLVGFILLPLSPTDQSDELSYHLPYAQFYLDNQGLAVNESLRYPLHTQNLNLLYSMGLAFSGPLMTHLIHASLAVLTAFGIYGFCQHYSNSLTGFMAVIVFLGFQKTVQAMTNAYVDLGVPCFLFASIFSLLKWQESDDRRFFILSAVSLGIVMGIEVHRYVVSNTTGSACALSQH